VEAFGGEGEEKRKPQNRRGKKRRTDCCGRFSDFWSFSTASRRPARRRRRRSRRQEKDV